MRPQEVMGESRPHSRPRHPAQLSVLSPRRPGQVLGKSEDNFGCHDKGMTHSSWKIPSKGRKEEAARTPHPEAAPVHPFVPSLPGLPGTTRQS